MIGRLHGLVVERALDGSCVVDVAGVGYELFVPMGALGRLPEPPDPVTLHVHTHVREDAITLFGFPTVADREAFRVVMGVSGVGPKLALALVSALGRDGIAAAVAAQDRAAFKGISGVGKKIGDRLLLELRDKLPALAGNSAAAPSIPVAPPKPTGPLSIVTGALVSLGFKPAEADLAVSRIGDPNGRPVEILLRDALRQLA